MGLRTSEDDPEEARADDGLLLALTATAGAVDAIGYLGLQRVFCANMTGNTVQLGLALAQGDGGLALRSGIALLSFASGVALGATLAGREPARSRWTSAIVAALVFEVLATAGAGALWWSTGPVINTGTTLALLAILALAMGVQSAVARQLGRAGVAATYVTGTVVAIAAGAVRAARQGTRPPVAQPITLQVADWAIYALGAAGGGFLLRHWASGAFLPPLLALVVIAATAMARSRSSQSNARAGTGSSRK
jgi:uncharacterized membrane protein YoaK (UPF0700 family)